MASLTIPSPLSLPLLSRPKTLTLKPHFPFRHRLHPPSLRLSSLPFASLSGDPPLVPVADLVERDWSFLELGESRSDETDRIIAAAQIRPDSKVFAAMPTVGFIDRVVESSPCELLAAIHESLLVLAMIKENHDKVRCWQGGIDAVPERFGPFDVVFLCYFPGMGVSINRVLGYLAGRCSEGARLVISYEQGREIIEQQHQQQYPDIRTSMLPHRVCLEKAAADYSLQIIEFVDEDNFYLAVLRFCKVSFTCSTSSILHKDDHIP